MTLRTHDNSDDFVTIQKPMLLIAILKGENFRISIHNIGCVPLVQSKHRFEVNDFSDFRFPKERKIQART